MKWRETYVDGVAHPETGGLCEVEVSFEGATHPGKRHVYTEWEDGEIVGPVYWDDPPVTENEQMLAAWRSLQ